VGQTLHLVLTELPLLVAAKVLGTTQAEQQVVLVVAAH
jgi:hypothetical protein